MGNKLYIKEGGWHRYKKINVQDSSEKVGKITITVYNSIF